MSNLIQRGLRVWSYQTCIRDVLPDGRTIGNATHYSPTTSVHQNAVSVRACDVVVSDVPRGTESLTAWFLRSARLDTERRAA
jgi:hypothetical protein